LKIHKEEGINSYEIKKLKVFAAFVEKDTLLLSSSKDWIAAAIAKKGGANAPTLNKDLVALMNEGSGKEILWAAMVPNQLLDLAPKNNKQLADLAQKIKNLKAGITLTESVKVSARIQATDDKAARDIHKNLLGAKALLIFFITTSDQLKDYGPALTEIVNSIKFSRDKSTVGVDLNVSGKQIEEGLKK